MLLIEILRHTPAWVWAVLAALLWLGGSQTRDREVPVLRLAAMPLAMLGWSFTGVLAPFAHVAIVGWLAGVALAVTLGRRVFDTSGARRVADGRVWLPGSWAPLALILTVFVVKYSVGVTIAMHPDLAARTSVALACGTVYGLFSGLFAARALGVLARVRMPA